jgi:hypothetical protein
VREIENKTNNQNTNESLIHGEDAPLVTQNSIIVIIRAEQVNPQSP